MALFAALCGIGVALRYTLGRAARAGVAVVLSWPAMESVRGATASAFGIFVLLVLAFVAARLRRGLPRALVGAAVAGVVLLGLYSYLSSLRDDVPRTFDPEVTALAPRSSIEDPYPNRPHYPYRTNRWGFREPEFAIEKPPGVVRVVTIGDSYVFGIGVPVEETLARRLEERLSARHPSVRFEVVNLGMPGNNFVSYLPVYRAAVERLAPDGVVLCLTLPNDLSAWDWGTEARAAHRLSLYSAARWLLETNAAAALFSAALLERAATPEAVARFEGEVQRLFALRSRLGAPPLFVLPYSDGWAFLDAALGKQAGVTLLPAPHDDPAFFIPGDGHPTGTGNRRFADDLASALERDPAIAPRLR